MVCALQDTMVRLNGGERGVRDLSGIYFSLDKIARFRQADPAHVAALFYCEFACKHHFTDGNKRISHLLAKLRLIHRSLHLTVYYRQASPFIVELAQGTKTFDDAEHWVTRHSQPFAPHDRQKHLNMWLAEYTNIEKYSEDA